MESGLHGNHLMLKQGPACASFGRARSARGAGGDPGAAFLQGEDEDVRARVWGGLHAQGQGKHRVDQPHLIVDSDSTA